MKSHIVLILIIAFLQYVKAQNQLLHISTGLAAENKDYLLQNKVIGSVNIVSNKKFGPKLPVPLDHYLPSVLDQGSQGSCTAFVVAEALSIRENYINNITRTTQSINAQILYSPTYLWVLGNDRFASTEDCSKRGMAYSKAFSCIFNNKLVYWETYPYPINDKDLCHSECPPEVLNNKLEDKKFAYDDVILDTLAFKSLLNQGYPICIATNLDMGYYEALHDTKGKWLQKKTLTGEQHAMLIVDYDDKLRCFKVLDSHGDKLSDNGIIWLSYDLVNRTLDEGVVYGQYIVSFENSAEVGPFKILSLTTGLGSNSFPKMIAMYRDSTFIGKILDEEGNGMLGVNVTEKGSPNGTVSDFEGNFELKAHYDATVVFSFIGFDNIEGKFKIVEKTVYPSNSFTTWTKNGYYKVFNGIRFGISNINDQENTALLLISDDNSGKIITNNIELKKGQMVEITINKNKYVISLKDIKSKSNKLEIGNNNSVFIKYSLISDTETLTQIF